MSFSNLTRRWSVAVALGAIAIGALATSAAGAPAVVCHSVQPVNLGSGFNELRAVAVVSRRDVVAVGDYLQTYNQPRTLIERWNGSTWRVQTSPSRGPSELVGVTATSSGSAWAVGKNNAGALIEHWNGTTWSVQASPRFAGELVSVVATSARNVWAVGSGRSGAVIEHWNGRAWKIQARLHAVQLLGVAATSSRNAWAVGGDGSSAVIEHWNGKRWSRLLSLTPPDPSSAYLSGVAASSPTSVWAVGATDFPITPDSIVQHVLLEHRNTRGWQKQHTDSAVAALSGVSATSSSNAWAIGSDGYSSEANVVEHWNGRAWTAQPSDGPATRFNEALWGVSARSSAATWVVGSYYNATAQQRQTLALRCNT